jgi:two-component system OmpR family sensor kinase
MNRYSKNKKDHITADDPNLKYYFSESDFSLIEDRKIFHKILERGHVVLEKRIGKSSTPFKVTKFRNHMYLLLDNSADRIILQDNQLINFGWQILLLFLAVLVFLLILYLWLTKSLRPLKYLQTQIQKVAAGDLTVSIKSDGNDEIAQVSRAFDGALRKLESLVNSRQFFLQSIMHELKTPIAKGKLMGEFLEKEDQKEGYDAVFERLEMLLGEFSKIEQMLSSNYQMKLMDIHAIDLVEQALELQLLNEEETREQVELIQKKEYIFHTDFELFSLALKNIIDNALKYSYDHKVTISIDENGIEIRNSGDYITDSLESFQKPFYGQSRGLGLYIVKHTFEILSLQLSYSYHDGVNIFRISQP